MILKNEPGSKLNRRQSKCIISLLSLLSCFESNSAIYKVSLTSWWGYLEEPSCQLGKYAPYLCQWNFK